MTTAILLAGGVGVRMRTNGLPKQFIELNHKPIICYTIDTFEACKEVDQIVIPCNEGWVDHLKEIVEKHGYKKVKAVVTGGVDRQDSINKGLAAMGQYNDDDIVVIHDGVRPLVKMETIVENIKTAQKYGNAMTVRQNIETVVITTAEDAGFDNFYNRDHTYTLTAPQTFKVGELISSFKEYDAQKSEDTIPILDASLLYAYLGKRVYLVKETGPNIKITTPEDYYYFKSLVELQENLDIFGA